MAAGAPLALCSQWPRHEQATRAGQAGPPCHHAAGTQAVYKKKAWVFFAGLSAQAVETPVDPRQLLALGWMLSGLPLARAMSSRAWPGVCSRRHGVCVGVRRVVAEGRKARPRSDKFAFFGLGRSGRNGRGSRGFARRSRPPPPPARAVAGHWRQPCRMRSRRRHRSRRRLGPRRRRLRGSLRDCVRAQPSRASRRCRSLGDAAGVAAEKGRWPGSRVCHPCPCRTMP